jgi:hypothetical protein
VIKHRWLLVVLAIAGLLLVLIGELPPLKVAVALLAIYLLVRIGVAVIGSFARPIPAPPPPGELRRVKIGFRCSLCGTEVRMTVANDEIPHPPRHCQEDMDFVAPVME